MSDSDATAETDLTIGRIAGALALGAVTGALATILLFALSAYALPDIGPGMEAKVDFSVGVLGTWAILALFAVAVWTLGLIVIGGPAWLIMHRIGLRARFHAMTIGALLAGVAGYVLGALAYAPYPTAWFVAFALIGMIVGWLIWSLAYGRKSRSLGPAE